jgi:2-polyprenyl-3-methyl-5-hydroxy-6-metoxy-1,4-benzoquinol methylase
VPILTDELETVHSTRRELIEEPVRARLAEAGPGATALDLACNEGYFSQWLLEWGAARVVGIDIRDVHIRR